MSTALNEASLESLIESHLVEANSYAKGDPADYDRTLCIDVPQLLGFLKDTQPELVKKFSLGEDGQPRAKFLSRLASEVRKRGVVDVLRSGFGHQAVQKIRLFYPTPSAHNEQAKKKHALNRWVVTRQLRYSQDEQARSLDMAIFQGYRCFDGQFSGFWDIRPVSVIVGRNNPGKSHPLKPAEFLCRNSYIEEGVTSRCGGILREDDLR